MNVVRTQYPMVPVTFDSVHAKQATLSSLHLRSSTSNRGHLWTESQAVKERICEA
jgi:hypothetical protein